MSETGKRLDAIAGYLKYNYRNHLSMHNSDGFHDISHALLRGLQGPSDKQTKQIPTCKLCLCPSKIVKDIASKVVTDNPSVSTALNEASHKFKLYMGHCIRAKVQQDRITEVMESMKRDGEGKRCVMYIDFKMKQVPKKLREPSQDWFRKRGMSWHGVAVFYDQSESEKRAEVEENLKLREVRTNRKGKNACKKEVSVDGMKRRDGDLKLFFVDTVLENTGEQDTDTTVNIIDSLCVRLKKEIRDLKEVIVISDNVANYGNNTLPLITYSVIKSHSLRLLEVLHPDAQQSRNMVDAHFGIGGRQVDKYIREKDLGVITPDDIAQALVYDGGIKVTAVDFVRINRGCSRMKKWFSARDAKKNKQFDSIGKCGVIQFEAMEKRMRACNEAKIRRGS